MDKYLHYNSIELAEDPTFIAWVKKVPSNDGLNWDEWVQANPSMTDVVNEAKNLIGQINFKKGEVSKAQSNRVWVKILQDINQEKAPKFKTSIVRRLISIGAAAAVAVLLWVTVFDRSNTTIIQSQFAETKVVDLPDGTEVSINSDSKIGYNSDDWKNTRTIKLEGEAFFKVKKGSTFSVNTDMGTVEVLGTSFNVFTREGLLDVVCETGKVSVTAQGETTILTPGQAVKISKSNRQYIESVDQSNTRSNWIKGLYSYEAENLNLVLNDVSRQFNVVIQSDENLNQMKFTGSFKIGDMELALSEVLWPMGLKFENQDGVIIITK
jgi:ferric-dicitrate binding protein FerR (iron transport regulator)